MNLQHYFDTVIKPASNELDKLLRTPARLPLKKSKRKLPF